jgi:hypothetical protein
MTTTCDFDEAWRGRCKTPKDECEKHADLKCASCGLKAIKSCDHTGGFVCGAPLCGGCMHSPPNADDPNYFGMGGGHAPIEVARKKWEASWG